MGNCYKYLHLWSQQFEYTEQFKWIALKEDINFDEVQLSLEFILTQMPDVKVNETLLYYEVSLINRFMNQNLDK